MALGGAGVAKAAPATSPAELLARKLGLRRGICVVLGLGRAGAAEPVGWPVAADADRRIMVALRDGRLVCFGPG